MHVRVVWVTLLALKNRHHIVEASVPGIAALARVTLEEASDAVRVLESPDAHSRSKDHEGRRIQSVDGGWLVLNGEKYQRKLSAEERRVYLREKQAESRARRKSVNTPSTGVNDCQQGQHIHSTATASEEREGGAANLPVELPKGFPATEADAAKHAAFAGCTEDFALLEWNQVASRGGTDYGGNPITSFRHYLSARWQKERGRQGGAKVNGRGTRPKGSAPDHSKPFFADTGL
jgi:hypothetical protein